MNTQSNAILDTPGAAQGFAPAVIPESRLMYWSVVRELWESRSIYIAPLAVAALILLGFLIATIGRALSEANLAQRRAVLEEPYSFAALLIMATTFIVSVFYCLDALHGERRDRSILFWKSLPVSDLTTVLAKAAIPLVVLPLLTFAITVVTQWIMALVSSAVLLESGLGVAPLWTRLSLSQTWLMLLYHLVTVHALWYAPIYGWLLLVSAWARRAAFLWAGLPLLAIALVEKIAFNTTHFAAILGNRMSGGAEAVTMPGSSPMDPMTHLTPGHFLTSPGLWIGLATTAGFLAGAVRLRRSQGSI
ncbi:MAG: ABC transporter permease [Acidobacteriota bacterium]|nr:ABC transporter permease [Acidobacteriota bacterium]